MALTTWKNAPNGMIRNPDVSIAKNYLNEMEMDDLNRIVSMYLDYAERQAKKRTAWITRRSQSTGVGHAGGRRFRRGGAFGASEQNSLRIICYPFFLHFP